MYPRMKDETCAFAGTSQFPNLAEDNHLAVFFRTELIKYGELAQVGPSLLSGSILFIT